MSFPPHTIRAVATVMLILLAQSAHALVLCGVKDTRTGGLREGAVLKVRSVCKTSEVPVDPAPLGLQGPPGVTNVVVRTGSPVTTSGSLSTPAVCLAGEVATGGGGFTTGANGGSPVLSSSRPQPETDGATPTSWRITAHNQNAPTGTITATAFVVCAAP